MSDAQAEILLLSLLWLSFFIKSDCLLLRQLLHPLYELHLRVLLGLSGAVLFTLLQLITYSNPIYSVVSGGA